MGSYFTIWDSKEITKTTLDSLLDRNVKEANVAYEEEYIINLITQNNLFIEKSFNGFWSGRPKKESFDFQDTLIISKR